MIIILKQNANPQKVEELKQNLVDQGFKLHLSEGTQATLIGLIGDTSHVHEDWLRALDAVDSIRRIREPYKKANRSMHPEDTVIDICGNKIGSGHFQVIAGPCSIETKEQIIEVAEDVKRFGAHFLRGGAFKPRTSPYAFQGLHEQGLDLLLEAKKATGLPVVTEIMSPEHLPLFEDVDVIQVGARNMQNFELLKELGKIKKPILLKRGLANTLSEFLMSAEYIMSEGNQNVILCERGIRAFDTYARNTLDLTAVPMLHELSHLPVIVDPSHATGKIRLIPPMALAAVACGADGVMIEVHNDPIHALCDGAQSLKPEQFADLAKRIRIVREAVL